MPRFRIFVSFDGDHDADLHDLLRTESTRPGCAFELSAHSQGGSITDAWTGTSRARIRAADLVVVICGVHTNDSPRVAAELGIAQAEKRPYLLVWGRREQMCTKPQGAKSSDAMYSWTRDILEGQVRLKGRSAKPVPLPESYKRP